MATSYSSNLALALPVTGSEPGTWGTVVNDNITNMLDQALGYQAFTATGGSDTLTIPDGTTGVARSIYIQLNGTGGGTVNVPTAKTKMYFVFNNTASAITFKVTSQTGVSIPAAAKIALVSNGTDIIVAENYFAALTLGAPLPTASGGTGATSTTFVNLATNVTGTLPVANGGTSLTTLTANNVILGNGTSAPTFVAPGTSGNVLKSDGTTWQSGAAAASLVQYPQLIKSADYTLVFGDAGYQIFHPATDTAARTFTIPANSSVAFPIGTVVLFVNPAGSQQVTVAITTDTLINMRGITGPQIVTANNILTALKITATRWMCYFADTDPAPTQFLAIAHFTTPFITTYTWSSAGFGTKYTNPATSPAGDSYSASFSPDGTALAVAHDSTPFVTAYPWSSAGFGIKFADPATTPTGAGRGVAFSPSGTQIVIGHNLTPWVSVYNWASSGFGTKYTDPATTPTGLGNGVAFSPAGTELAVAHENSPRITAYPWSSAGFGTKYTDPATLPTGDGVGVAFSPTGTELAVGHKVTPSITVYPWSSAGFGTKYTNPATLPIGNGAGVAFSPAGTELVIGHGTTPFVTAYPWSSAGFGVKFANPATLPTGSGWDVAFSPAGTELIVPHNTTPFVSAYPWSVSGFGTKFADPATTPTGQGYAAALVRT